MSKRSKNFLQLIYIETYLISTINISIKSKNAIPLQYKPYTRTYTILNQSKMKLHQRVDHFKVVVQKCAPKLYLVTDLCKQGTPQNFSSTKFRCVILFSVSMKVIGQFTKLQHSDRKIKEKKTLNMPIGSSC
jgi:hypothetical protein